MEQISTVVRGKTIGVDLGDKYSDYCMLDGDGEVLTQGRIRTTQKHMTEYFSGLDRARVVIEAGTHSPWISRVLDKCGHEVVVANARQLPLIYKNRNKNDQLDPVRLARLARMDLELLSPIQHRGEQAQADLAVPRTRNVLVHNRTSLVNHVRGSVKSVGGRIPKGCSTASFHKKALAHIPPPVLPALRSALEALGALSPTIRELNKRIDFLCEERYPETKLLRQIDGVGPITALTYVLTICDPYRFERSREVAAFLGLVPRRDKSGMHDPELRITRAGDKDLRRLLVQCAHYILGPFGADSDLRRWGLALASRGKKNAKKRAAVAVARKLAVLLHRLWVTGEEYDPLRNNKCKGGNEVRSATVSPASPRAG